MTSLPVILIQVLAIALGGANLWLRFRGIRKPILIGVHLLAGLAALELLVFYLKDVNNGEGLPAGPYGNIAAAFLAVAAFSGLISPILGRRSKLWADGLIATHVGSGLLGAVTAIAWATSRL